MPWVALGGAIVLLAVLTGRGGDLASFLSGTRPPAGGGAGGVGALLSSTPFAGLPPPTYGAAPVAVPSYAAASSDGSISGPSPTAAPIQTTAAPLGNYSPQYASSAGAAARVAGASSGASGGSGGRLGAGNTGLIDFLNSQVSTAVGGFNPVVPRSSGTQAI